MTAKVFTPKDPAEVLNCTFDFESILGSETITPASQQVAVALDAGVDPTPWAILSGSPNLTGMKVVQRIQGGVHNADYRLTARVTTDGGRTLVIAAVLPVRNA